MDLFKDSNMKMSLKINDDSNIYFNDVMNIQDIMKMESSFELLRTPQHNLMEIVIEWPHMVTKESLIFSIEIFSNPSMFLYFYVYKMSSFLYKCLPWT